MLYEEYEFVFNVILCDDPRMFPFCVGEISVG